MYRIEGSSLLKLIPLLKKETLDYPMTMGVLDGTFSGHAMVDNMENPGKALVMHKHIGYMQYLGGQPDSFESKLLASSVLNYTSDRFYCNWVELANYPLSIISMIKDKYPDMKSFHRISWNHNRDLFHSAPNPVPPEGCSIQLLQKKNFKHKFLRYETEMFWDSTDIFLETAFGVVALDKKDKFLGVCSSVSASDNFFEINIEVKKNHRRKGIGYTVAHRYIKECFRYGKIPHWDCHEHNEPSQALAKKLGFEEAGRYPLISWEY